MTAPEEMVETVARAIAKAAMGSDEAWLVYVPQADAAIAALPVPEKWQDIANAPKDGSPLWLYDSEYADEEMSPSCEGHWADCREDGTPGFVGAIWNNCQDYWATVSLNPTHWMPFPPPPAAIRALPPTTES